MFRQSLCFPKLILTGESKNVTITFLEERNSNSLGCEAWFGFPASIKIVSSDKGWKKYNDGYLCVTSNPPIVVELPAGQNVINSGKHSSAGMISITEGENQSIIDLYSITECDFDISIDNPWTFKLTFLKIAIIIAVFIICLFAINAIEYF